MFDLKLKNALSYGGASSRVRDPVTGSPTVELAPP